MTKFLAIAMGLLALGLLPLEAQAKKKTACTAGNQLYSTCDRGGGENRSQDQRGAKAPKAKAAPASASTPPSRSDET